MLTAEQVEQIDAFYRALPTLRTLRAGMDYEPTRTQIAELIIRVEALHEKVTVR